MIGRQVKREASFLFLGDLVFFVFALWLALGVRYWAWPSAGLFLTHLKPFGFVFFLWLVTFFVADLYNCRPSLGRERLAETVVRAQLVNSFLTVLFFYFVPSFGITPKTILFVDLIISIMLILWWRLTISNFLYRGRTERYFFFSQGSETEELKRVLTTNQRHHVEIVPGQLTFAELANRGIAVAVTNLYDQPSPTLRSNFYRSIFSGVRFISLHELYEDIFGRIPITVIDERWLVEHAKIDDPSLYRFLKRFLDLLLTLILLILSLPFFPFIILLVKLEDGGPVFYTEQRVGQYGRLIKIRKFRSMSSEPKLEDRRITRVGQWLRRSRLDELPQLWSVVTGGQSLVGPRPERPDYVALYEQEIPYYHARHLVQPGLSGWAQIYQQHHPHFAIAAAATREKLSYDLYYVKNRSFWLDLKIALKTIRILLSRTGL
ncbi:MAG: sugar transferase [Patescibacteria group bacterium]